MIGWRPYLFTFLALVLAALAILDVSAAGSKSRSCTSADALEQARNYADARTAYASVLQSDPKSACALAGMRQAEYGLCVRAQRIAPTDATEAHSQLIALAEGNPPPGPASCVWKQLRLLAAKTTAKGKK
jgi:hypothetical protein